MIFQCPKCRWQYDSGRTRPVEVYCPQCRIRRRITGDRVPQVLMVQALPIPEENVRASQGL